MAQFYYQIVMRNFTASHRVMIAYNRKMADFRHWLAYFSPCWTRPNFPTDGRKIIPHIFTHWNRLQVVTTKFPILYKTCKTYGLLTKKMILVYFVNQKDDFSYGLLTKITFCGAKQAQIYPGFDHFHARAPGRVHCLHRYTIKDDYAKLDGRLIRQPSI